VLLETPSFRTIKIRGSQITGSEKVRCFGIKPKKILQLEGEDDEFTRKFKK
jgi:hypothetical protein